MQRICCSAPPVLLLKRTKFTFLGLLKCDPIGGDFIVKSTQTLLNFSITLLKYTQM